MNKLNNSMLKLDVTIYGNVTKISDTLSKARVRIFYKGLNRNRTFISEEFANQLIASLPYAPVKGIFEKDDLDFEDHGEDNTDGRIYGVVADNPNFAWEKHLDDDGVEREYACADVILYTALYPEANLIIGKGQSMEIYRNTLEYEWRISETDGEPYVYFKKGCLLGLQILGDEHKPCFEGAAFFTLLKEAKELVDYIKNYSKVKEERNKMDKSLFRLSDSDKADYIWSAINPNFTEEGNWQCDYMICDVYDDYALCFNRAERKYERVYYTKDDNAETVTIGDKVDVYIVDVTATERTALEVMKSIGGTYEKAVELYNENTEKISALETASAEAATNMETLNTEFEETKKNLAAAETALEESKAAFEALTQEKETISAEFEQQIADLKTENVRVLAEKDNIFTEKEALAEFRKNVEMEQKEAIIAEFSEYLNDNQISALKESMDNYTVENFKKEVCITAYDSNPTKFGKKDSNEPLYFKGGSPEGNVVESGVVQILNKHKNGGNK